MVLTVGRMEVSCSDEARLPKVWFYLLPMSIKLSLTAMFEFNMEYDKTMLYRQSNDITLITVGGQAAS